MIRIILGDNQSIFRAGAARVLTREEDMCLLAQCESLPCLLEAINGTTGCIILAASTMVPDPYQLVQAARKMENRSVLVLERNQEIPEGLGDSLRGMVTRGVTGTELIACIRQVARGERSIPSEAITESKMPGNVATRVRQRLTPREMQIVGHIVQGCKNKEIALQMGTKEQVVKNYLRSIYDKTGVSDRLELALFAIHHRLVAEHASAHARQIHMV